MKPDYDKETRKLIQLLNKYDQDPEFGKYIQDLNERIENIEIEFKNKPVTDLQASCEL